MFFEIDTHKTVNTIVSMAQGKWYFRLKGQNGEIVVSGEGYNSKQACLHGIDLVKKIGAHTPVYDFTLSAAANGISNAVNSDRFEIRTTNRLLPTPKDNWYFRYQAANHETVFLGTGYDSKQACQVGIELVKLTDSNTPIHDLSLGVGLINSISRLGAAKGILG